MHLKMRKILGEILGGGARKPFPSKMPHAFQLLISAFLILSRLSMLHAGRSTREIFHSSI